MEESKPYSEYMQSGQPWLGKVPAHWQVVPGFAAFHEKQVKNAGMKVPDVLSLSYGKIVVKPPEKLHGLVPESFETYQIVDPDDIIVRPTDLQNDWHSIRVGLSKHRGIITSAYLCLKPTPLTTPEYCYLLLLSYDILKFFYGMGSGLRQNLDYKDLKRFPFLVPPPAEQAAIVRFVEAVDRRVNRLVRAKQRLIELLTEQKQAIITHTVTRGLNPDVKVKPSGTNWLGDVPEHWDVRPLKHCVRRGSSISYGIVQPGDHVLDGIPFVQTGNLTNLKFELGDLQRTTPEIAAKFPRSVLTPGDVLLGIRASVGMAAVAPASLAGANLSRGIARIVPGDGVSSNYLTLYLISRPVRTFWSTYQQGTTFNEIPIALVRSLPVALPPLDEQARMVAAADDQTRPVNNAIHTAEREIDLIREYRTRLVADVVTGKLDVRAASARLPDDDAKGFEEPVDGSDERIDDESADAEEAGEEVAVGEE